MAGRRQFLCVMRNAEGIQYAEEFNALDWRNPYQEARALAAARSMPTYAIFKRDSARNSWGFMAEMNVIQ